MSMGSERADIVVEEEEALSDWNSIGVGISTT